MGYLAAIKSSVPFLAVHGLNSVFNPCITLHIVLVCTEGTLLQLAG
jgi:hypothetical protein